MNASRLSISKITFILVPSWRACLEERISNSQQIRILSFFGQKDVSLVSNVQILDLKSISFDWQG